jgi:hypothetical protein
MRLPNYQKPMKTKRTPEKDVITYTMVQTMLDCYTHCQDDRQMMESVAREAGLLPLSDHDRAVLLEHIGEDRLAKFINATTR